MTKLTHPSTNVVVVAFGLSGVLAAYVAFRLAFFTVAAAHVLDIPKPAYDWLPRFFWASVAIPAIWLLSVGATFFEMKAKKRYGRIVAFLVAPAVPAIVQFVSWQVYLASLR